MSDEVMETPEIAPEVKEEPKAETPKPKKKPKTLLKGFDFMGRSLDLDEEQAGALLRIGLEVYELRRQQDYRPMMQIVRKVKASALSGLGEFSALRGLDGQLK